MPGASDPPHARKDLAAIFISYRRDDQVHAIALKGELDNEFDLFFDQNPESIDPGQRWDLRLEQGLEDCRVFLAVIGLEWGSERNLERLQDPEDWVRREIETALDRDDALHVVPILMGGAQPPRDDALPPSLRALFFRRQFLQIREDGWPADMAFLVGRLHAWLATPASTAARREPVADRVGPLCQLCDRVSQERGIGRVLRPESRHPAMILFGHKAEDHCGFLDSLAHRKALHRVLGMTGGGTGVSIHPLRWDGRDVAGGRFRDALTGAIAADVIGDIGATEAEVREHFRQARQPSVLFLYVDWNAFRLVGPGLFKGFVDAWSALLTDDGVDLAATPAGGAYPVMLWLLVSYAEEAQAAEMRAAIQSLEGVLPELDPLAPTDVKTWTQMPEVKPLVREVCERIEALAETPGTPDNKLHMSIFVDGVKRLFA